MDTLQYLSPPVFLYNKFKPKKDEDRKNPTLLQQSGSGNTAGTIIGVLLLVALYYYSITRYFKRGKIMDLVAGGSRGTGRKILAWLNIIFQPWAYAIYALMDLYIPYISAVHPKAYAQIYPTIAEQFKVKV